MASLDDICRDLAWSHWDALGVRGVVPPTQDAIDLEALILFTPTLREIDPRLYDEALDWCVQFAANTVSVSRLRRLAARLPEDQAQAFAGFAGAARQHADLKWPAGRAPAHRHKLSGKSKLPSPFDRPALLQLRARRLAGVNARAEVLAFLITRGPDPTWSASDLTQLGYAKQNLAPVLEDLVDAGVAERIRSGNQHRYRLIRRDALRAVLAPLPRWAPSWAARLPVLADLRATLSRVDEKPEIVRDVEVSRTLSRHLPAFRVMGLADSSIPIKGAASRGIVEWANRELGSAA